MGSSSIPFQVTHCLFGCTPSLGYSSPWGYVRFTAIRETLKESG